MKIVEMQDNRKESGVDWNVVALDKFIQATRDSGYRGTSSALAELVDNSIQAGATDIAVSVDAAGESELGGSVDISVCDNGCGMDPFTLRQALRFGGSTRFGDRRGLGRFGMGLPNASLSQARRVTVYTWQSNGVRAANNRLRSKPTPATGRTYTSHLDVDLIASGAMVEIPKPTLATDLLPACMGNSGTLVVWSRCDRLDNTRVSTIVRKLEADLGRRFRHFLWRGVRIVINGKAVKPYDPLCLNVAAPVNGAKQYGQELRYEIRVSLDGTEQTSVVRVRFSELPVHKWHRLSNEEKRLRGVVKGAGVSIVRAGREVDHGWYFMGGKRRENYDDWWRCEVQFEPMLDDLFGIGHTKQQVRPQSRLLEALTPDLEATARLLNRRARQAHFSVKSAESATDSERVATDRNHLLAAIPAKTSPHRTRLMKYLERKHPAVRKLGRKGSLEYSIVAASARDTRFYSFAYDRRKFVLLLNQDHPFYREVFKSLADGATQRERKLRSNVELLLLAAARSEAQSAESSPALSRFRVDWSNILAAFLNDK